VRRESIERSEERNEPNNQHRVRRESIERSEERNEPNNQHRVRRRRWLAAAAVVVPMIVAGPAVATPSPDTSSPASTTAQPASGPARAVGSEPIAPAQDTPIQITIRSMTPRSPNPLDAEQKVVITATITNTTDTTYTDVQVQLQRGSSISQQHLLDEAIVTPPEPDGNTTELVDLRKQLLPHGAFDVVYRTTSGAMCLCFDGAVYPYDFVVQASSEAAGGFVEVGRQQLLVPSFFHEPASPAQVAWLWPLLSKPHRSMSDTVFEDDDLASEVAPGGRLYRALKTAQLLDGRVRLTLVLDPDLIDSLVVMKTGYKVRSGSSEVTGTGGAVATTWLSMLKTVAAKHDVTFTPFADPDVDAIVRVGMTWSPNIDAQAQQRIATIVQPTTPDIFWPDGGQLTNEGLDTVGTAGYRAVVLDNAALPAPADVEPRPSAIAPLPTPTGGQLAAVTDDTLQAIARRTLAIGATPAVDQQQLLSEVAVRVAQDSEAPNFVLIVPPRYVDTDPVAASQTIALFVGTGWSRTVSLTLALDSVEPVDRGALRVPADIEDRELSSPSMATLRRAMEGASTLRSALTNEDATALLGGFAPGIQRAESVAWRQDRSEGEDRASAIGGAADALTSAVHLVEPTTRNYSLSSDNAPIVVTVQNELTRDVTVQVSLQALLGSSGFSSAGVAPQLVPARSRKTVSIPTKVDRIDRFKVIANLTAPDGTALGTPLELNVRSTRIGGITKVVTALAGTVLILALLLRAVRRVRRGYEKELPHTVGATR